MKSEGALGLSALILNRLQEVPCKGVLEVCHESLEMFTLSLRPLSLDELLGKGEFVRDFLRRDAHLCTGVGLF